MASTYRSYLLPQLRDSHAGQEGMSEVLPGLFVGSLKDSKDAKQLERFRITHILSVHDNARKVFKDKKYLLITASDSPRQDLLQFVAQCNDFIHAARMRGGHVLVHCLAGISRSVTLTAAYLSSTAGLSHQEALQAVRSARTSVSPNIGFQRQLLEFEQSGLEKERQRLKDKFRVRPALSPHARRAGRLNSFGSPASLSSETHASTPPSDNLTLGDAAKCQELLTRYRRLVLGGDICGGDCPDGGMSCPSGICRAHLRSFSTSFLRRGSASASIVPSTPRKSERKLWNPWSVDIADQQHQLRPGPRTELLRPGSAREISAGGGGESFTRNGAPQRALPPGAAPLLSQRKAFQKQSNARSMDYTSTPSHYASSARGCVRRSRNSLPGTPVILRASEGTVRRQMPVPNHHLSPGAPLFVTTSANSSPAMERRTENSYVSARNPFRKTRSMTRADIATRTAALHPQASNISEVAGRLKQTKLS